MCEALADLLAVLTQSTSGIELNSFALVLSASWGRNTGRSAGIEWLHMLRNEIRTLSRVISLIADFETDGSCSLNSFFQTISLVRHSLNWSVNFIVEIPNRKSFFQRTRARQTPHLPTDLMNFEKTNNPDTASSLMWKLARYLRSENRRNKESFTKVTPVALSNTLSVPEAFIFAFKLCKLQTNCYSFICSRCCNWKSSTCKRTRSSAAKPSQNLAKA